MMPATNHTHVFLPASHRADQSQHRFVRVHVSACREFDTAAKELMRNPNFRFAKVRSTAVMEDFGIPTDRVTVQFYTGEWRIL